MSKDAEITALYELFVTTGRPPSINNPQWMAELNAINQKYGAPIIDATGQPENTQQQQQQQQQQTTTQDTGALANVGTEEDVGALANVGTDDQPEKEYAYLTSETGAKTIGSGKTRVYMTDEVTGQTFVYSKDPGDDEGFEGLSPQYYNIDPSNLKISSVLTKTGSEGSWEKQDIGDNLYFGGGVDPGTAAKWSAEANKDDKSDNDIYYEVMRQNSDGEWYAQGYTDSSGTGQSIPVGAFNITRDPHQLTYTDNVGTEDDPVYKSFDKDPSTYTQPVLTKTWQGYEPVTGMYSDVEGITPQQYANLSDEEKLLLAQSDVPTASTSFSDFFTPGSGQFDLGGYFGMDIDPTTGTSGLVLSNPPSNTFNLEKFFNQTESLGTQNFLRSQSTDVLNDIIMQGNFLDALLGRNFKMADGTMYYDKIYQPGYQAGFDDDGNYQVTGDAIQGFDMGQLEGFFNDLATNKDPYTGDTMYSNTAYSVDPYNITGTDNQGLQYDYAYSQRPLTAQAVRAYKGGLGPYQNVGYLTRYGYNPEIGDEILRYDEASGVYYDPVSGLPIPPENLEGFALGDPETVELQGTEDVFRGQMTTNPTTGEKLYYDADGNPVTEEEYLTFTDPMETGVT
jgi:hypothetical protein